MDRNSKRESVVFYLLRVTFKYYRCGQIDTYYFFEESLKY